MCLLYYVYVYVYTPYTILYYTAAHYSSYSNNTTIYYAIYILIYYKGYKDYNTQLDADIIAAFITFEYR